MLWLPILFILNGTLLLMDFFLNRSFKKALSDVILSRRAIRNLNTLYPDATAEDLANTDNVCIICREEMVTGIQRQQQLFIGF